MMQNTAPTACCRGPCGRRRRGSDMSVEGGFMIEEATGLQGKYEKS